MKWFRWAFFVAFTVSFLILTQALVLPERSGGSENLGAQIKQTTVLPLYGLIIVMFLFALHRLMVTVATKSVSLCIVGAIALVIVCLQLYRTPPWCVGSDCGVAESMSASSNSYFVLVGLVSLLACAAGIYGWWKHKRTFSL